VEASAEGREEGQAGPTVVVADDALAAHTTDQPTTDGRPARPWRLDRAGWWEVLGAALVALWVTRDFWWPGRYVVAFDTVAYSGPNMQVTLDAWRDARLPLWNDLIFGGVTHLGNPQAGALYPPKVVGLLLDTNRAMGVLVALHVVLMAVGTVLLVRRLACRPPAGFVAAVVLVAGGAVLTRAVQFEQILVLGWAPVLLLGTTAVLDSPTRRWGSMAGTGAVVAMVLLAGHPQIVYQLVVVAGVWSVAVVVRARGADADWSWGRVGDLAVALAAGAAVAAPQLVAAVAATRDSEIGIGRSLAELESPALSTRPEYLVQLLLGSVRRLAQDELSGGFESIGFLGAAGAVLAVVGVVHAWRRRGDRPLAVAVAVLAVLGVVWALGPRTPLFTVAYHWLPGFDLARGSARWLDVTALAAAIGVGWAVDGVVRRADLRAPAAVALGMLGVALLLAWTGVVLRPDALTVLAWIVVAAIVLGALVLARRRPEHAVAVVVAVVAVELLGTLSVSPIDRSRSHTAFDALASGPGAALAGEAGLAIALTDDAFGDTPYLVAGFRPNTNVLADARSLDGYDGGVQVTERFAELGRRLAPDVDPALPLRNKLPFALTPELAAELGVRWALIDGRRDVAGQLPGWTPTPWRDEAFEVWENPAWTGDAVLVGSDGPAAAGPLPLDQPDPGRMEVQLDGAAGRVVVHRQTAPGWRAEVDGRSVPVTTHDGFFLAVDVPAGADQLVLEYRPRWVVPALAVGTVGVIALAAVSAIGMTRRRPLKQRR
jgi:hypothetical protein